MSNEREIVRATYIAGFFAVVITLLIIFKNELREVILGNSGQRINQTTNDAEARLSDGEPLQIGDIGNFIHDGTRYSWKIMKDGKKWLTTNLDVEVQNLSWYYEDNLEYKEYGRLYTFEAAKKGCRLLGEKWKLPTDQEWLKMTNQYGQDSLKIFGIGGKAAYQALIEGGSSGFDALLGGSRDNDGSFLDFGSGGIYWSATERLEGYAYDYVFFGDNEKLFRYYVEVGAGFSVRCLQK